MYDISHVNQNGHKPDGTFIPNTDPVLTCNGVRREGPKRVVIHTNLNIISGNSLMTSITERGECVKVRKLLTLGFKGLVIKIKRNFCLNKKCLRVS